MKTPVLFRIEKVNNIKTKENKDTLLSLGNQNKSYKNITEAKKDLNVKTADEAYTILKNMYNEDAENLNEKFKVTYAKDKEKYKNKQEIKRNNVIKTMIKRNQEINQKIKSIKKKRQNEKTFNVNISVTYKEVIIKTSWEIIKNKDFLESFTCLTSQLDEQIDDFLKGFFPFRDDYHDATLIKYTYQVIKSMPKVDKQDVPMKRAGPLKLSFLRYFDNINKISYEDHKDKCVIEILKEHLKIKKEKTITDVLAEAALKLYGNKNWKVEEGVTGRMIKYFCQSKNISCLGLDQKNKVFVKHTRDEKIGHKYNSIIFYYAVGHFYIINDKDAVRHISQTFKENNAITTSLLNESQNKTEYKYIEFDDLFKYNYEFNDDIYDDDDLTIKEIEELERQETQELKRDYENEFKTLKELEKNNVIIYHQGNLNIELKKYIEIFGVCPKVKYESLSNVKQIILPNNIILTTTDGIIATGTVKDICQKQDLEFKNQSIELC